jgi:hypothetical protein
MWRHYVYIHRRADDNRVFYVGKGTLRADARVQNCERARDSFSRNYRWHRVFAKHGVNVEILASFATDADACEYECALIAHYGRKNLVNLTDGGDGCVGIKVTAETRAKLSVLARKPRTDAWVTSIRAARKNGGNGGVVKYGDKLPDAWRANLSASKIGTNNPMYGKTGAAHPNSRKVIDRATGEIYDSVQIAADALGYKMKTLYNWLSGHRPNTTTLELA